MENYSYIVTKYEMDVFIGVITCMLLCIDYMAASYDSNAKCNIKFAAVAVWLNQGISIALWFLCRKHDKSSPYCARVINETARFA